MRAIFLILFSALVALWSWFAYEVAPRPSPRPVALPAVGEAAPPVDLNNRGVALSDAGRGADALAYFERARDFRPSDPSIARNAAWQRARLEKRAWLRALVPASAAWVVFGALGLARRIVRGARDAARLERIRLRGDPSVSIDRRDERAEIPLDFSEPLDRLLQRHPLTIVWSSSAHGKHMKSRPPVSVDGAAVRVALDGDRLRKLRRYPGVWRAFLYLGRTPVGEAAARVA